LVGLPKDWVSAQMSDVTEYISRGKSPKYTAHSTLPVINQKSIRWSGIQEEYLKFIDPAQFELWAPERFIRLGDVLWNSTGTGTLGRACLITQGDLDPPKVVDSHVTIVRPNFSVIEPRYLFAWIRSPEVQDNILSLTTGTTNQIELSRAAVANLKIPLAPLNEQRRIADKLDRILARVEACRERCDRIPLLLKRFRQSVLAAATSGQLTEDWRERQGITQESWKQMIFKEACQEITVGFVGKMANQYQEEGIPFLRSLNVRPFRFEPKNLQFISLDFHRQILKSRLRPGDVVVVRTGAPGQCCVIPNEIGEANCSDLVIVRPKETLLPGYACIFINSSESQEFVRSEVVGVAQSHFNVSSMKITPLNLPIPEEQAEIVRRVETLFAYADRLEAQYQKARTHLDRLTPALLDKAFRGELVPQDPNDEPASLLLERIQAERQTTPKQTRKTKTSKKKPRKKEMMDLLSVLESAGNWLSAHDAFRECGVSDGAETEAIEKLFLELRDLEKEDRIEVERRGDEDWLRIRPVDRS
jgi:type I restriction enzyme S subunit